MDDILAKKNRHLFLEEKDNTHNSFIQNINYAVENIDTIKTFNDNVNSGTMQHLLETYLEQIGAEGNAWVVKLTEIGENILATTSGFNYAAVLTVNQDIETGATIILPEAMKYRVGTHMLLVSWNGTVCYNGEQYTENGSFSEWSNTITINVPLQEGDKLQFRVVALADSTAFINQVSSVLDNASVTATNSTESRSLANRFSDFINIKDYGAKGDGENDDTEAWNAWHTALGTKGMGYIPSGNYLVNGSLKKFPMGCLGNAKDDFKEIKEPYTNRFENSVPTGQGHFIENFRELTIHNYNEGISIAPSISLDTHIYVPEDATPITSTGLASGSLIASTHGIHIQHILTGGNSNNKLYTTCISTNAINDAVGDNDCGAISARATKTANAGIGDTGALGGRVDNYSHERGGVMGAEMVIYNYVQGNPRPSDFSWVSTGRWTTPLHVIASSSPKSADGYDAVTSPVTAAILMQGSGNGAYDAIQISRSMFKFRAGETFAINATGEPLPEGTPTSATTDANGHLAGTVGIDMGSFSEANGYPEHGIVLGYCTDHIYTPNQHLIVRAKGQKISTAGNISYYADTTNAGNTAYVFSHSGTNMASIVHVGTSTASTLTLNNTAAGTGVVLTATSLRKTTASSALTLGEYGYSWANIYADTGPWAGSDERLKTNIDGVDEALMRAWGRVNFKVFQFRDAVAEKGEASARLHVGVIAQHVQAAFEAEGLDASRYGLFGFDAWEAKEAQYNEWDEEVAAEFDENGTVLAPAHTIHHKDLISPAEEAGERYSIRYDEALALECAYQRWLGEQRDAKIEALMQRISALENNQ